MRPDGCSARSALPPLTARPRAISWRRLAPQLPASRLTALLLTMALLLPALPAAAAGAAQGGRGWRSLLERAAEEAVSSAYEGELLWVTWSDGAASAETIEVRHTTGELLVRTGGQTLSISDEGGGVTDHEGGWYSPLPATALVGVDEGLELLEDKYAATVAGVDQLLDRDCDVVDVHLRDGGMLRERLWLDRDSGLLLRRETYDGGGERVRLAAYLSLDMSPMAVSPDDGQATPGGSAALQRRGQDIIALDERELATLRRAGWNVPAVLPGGYHAREAYAMSAGGTQPLQVVYRDGLYSVSLFQQRGRPDWDSLPPGAQPVDGLDFPAFEWPRAVPERMVWEAGGSAWSLVGDAPSEELLDIVRALPNPDPPGLAERLRRGMARLWSLISPE